MRPIYSGFPGRLYRHKATAFLMARAMLFTLLRPVYRWSDQKRIFRFFLLRRLKLHVLSFSKPTGTEYQLLLGKKVIGRLLPGAKEWSIRPPFRLLVAESSLPSFSQKANSPKKKMEDKT
jgi:hypothetical protein